MRLIESCCLFVVQRRFFLGGVLSVCKSADMAKRALAADTPFSATVPFSFWQKGLPNHIISERCEGFQVQGSVQPKPIGTNLLPLLLPPPCQFSLSNKPTFDQQRPDEMLLLASWCLSSHNGGHSSSSSSSSSSSTKPNSCIRLEANYRQVRSRFPIIAFKV